MSGPTVHLNRLVAQPIYRDSIIIGKFLAGTAVIAIVIFSMGIALGAVGMAATGLVPDTEEVLRILIFLIFTVIYVAFWLALSILFSVVCRHAATSALASISVWIFFCDLHEPGGKYYCKRCVSGGR